MRMTAPRSVARVFKSNPSLIALVLIANHLWRKITSSFFAYSLGAPGLYLGPRCKIVGGRRISFGADVRAHGDLWLEAVTTYGDRHFDPHITIGQSVAFSDRVHISAIEQITVGNHVLMGSGIYISDHNHGAYKGTLQSHVDEPPAHRTLGGGGPVTIGDNVWIGDNVVILGPASIGSGAILGANSVIRGTVPSNAIAAGAPARVIKIFNPQTIEWEKV
jgi:acetyltransferase-like isoleucine patch superfamily enzyme